MPPPSCRLLIRAQPRAPRDDIAGMRGDAVVVKVTAAPVKGAANEAILDLLAKRLGLRRSQVRLVTGARARQKTIQIDGLARDEALQRLGVRLNV